MIDICHEFLFSFVFVGILTSITLCILLKDVFRIKKLKRSTNVFFILVNSFFIAVSVLLYRLGLVSMGIKTAITLVSITVVSWNILRIGFALSSISTLGLMILTAVGNAGVTVFLNYMSITYQNAIVKFDISVIAQVMIFIINVLVIKLLVMLRIFFIKRSRNRNMKLINITYLLITVLIISINFNYYNSFNMDVENRIFIINLILMIFYAMFSFVVVNVFTKYDEKKNELDYQVFYNKTLEHLMSDLRRFRHDYSNMLAVIGGYLRLKKYNDLEIYFAEISKEIKQYEANYDYSILDIKNAGLLGLLIYKLDYAKSKNVNFSIKVKDQIDEINMKVSEFCECLGILLDNAIEAAQESEKRLVVLEISDLPEGKTFMVKNSIKAKVDIEEIFKTGYSSKGKNRGVGLAIVRKIANKNRYVTLRTESSDDDFTQKLIIHHEE